MFFDYRNFEKSTLGTVYVFTKAAYKSFKKMGNVNAWRVLNLTATSNPHRKKHFKLSFRKLTLIYVVCNVLLFWDHERVGETFLYSTEKEKKISVAHWYFHLHWELLYCTCICLEYGILSQPETIWKLKNVETSRILYTWTLLGR